VSRVVRFRSAPNLVLCGPCTDLSMLLIADSSALRLSQLKARKFTRLLMQNRLLYSVQLDRRIIPLIITLSLNISSIRLTERTLLDSSTSVFLWVHLISLLVVSSFVRLYVD
jgi:hypothetical protein